MKSALFVDFDNVYSQLRQLQPDAAERFARHPSQWIGWLARSLALPDPHEDGEQRRLLVRRCYLNPNWYQNYRHAFLRAGFEIVDCPPVTSQGKTSTDIHMVLDIVDLLQHETRCDEFIVFSADADFTPVLRKLRRFDRRTTVLAIGFPSAAYQASADLLIDERLFIHEALGLGGATPDDKLVANGKGAEMPEARAKNGKVCAELTKPTGASSAEDKPGPMPKIVARPATADELSKIAGRVWAAIEESPAPVSAALLAARLRQEAPPEVMENWNGCGTFKSFFRSLGLCRLLWLSSSGGRVLDPSRHDVDAGLLNREPDSPWQGSGEMFAVVRDVCTLTGAPMLAPRDLKQVLAVLAQVIQDHGFELARTASIVRDRCLESTGLRVRQRDVTFLLRGMQLAGHVFGQGNDDLPTLALRLGNQLLFLCEREQKLLSGLETDHIRHWANGTAMPQSQAPEPGLCA